MKKMNMVLVVFLIGGIGSASPASHNLKYNIEQAYGFLYGSMEVKKDNIFYVDRHLEGYIKAYGEAHGESSDLVKDLPPPGQPPHTDLLNVIAKRKAHLSSGVFRKTKTFEEHIASQKSNTKKWGAGLTLAAIIAIIHFRKRIESWVRDRGWFGLKAYTEDDEEESEEEDPAARKEAAAD